jgi:hypothetical protein
MPQELLEVGDPNGYGRQVVLHISLAGRRLCHSLHFIACHLETSPLAQSCMECAEEPTLCLSMVSLIGSVWDTA